MRGRKGLIMKRAKGLQSSPDEVDDPDDFYLFTKELSPFEKLADLPIHQFADEDGSHLNGSPLKALRFIDDFDPQFEEDDPFCPCRWGHGSPSKCHSANIGELVMSGEIPVTPCLRIGEEAEIQ